MAMHQANYIPWAGYFYKIATCDVFVYLDCVQYPRGSSFSARNSIKTPNGSTFLTIPVSIPKGQQGKALYTDITFSGDQWMDKHKKTLSLNYKKAPHFEEIFQLYEKVVNSEHTLIDLNIALIEEFIGYLEIKTERKKLSDILSSFGQKTDLIIDICKALSSDNYLSGTGGGKEYNDEKKLNENGIKLTYSNFQHPQYKQLWNAFMPNLSIMDLLFNHGKKSRNILLNSRLK